MKHNKTIKQIIEMYSGSGWKSIFAKIRVWDAPYIEVEKLVPSKGQIVDLGCGEGFFSNYLALSSAKRNVLGIELDKNRVKLADRGLKNTKFKAGSALKVNIPVSEGIILFHVLHHLPSYSIQEKLINLLYKRLKKGGKLIVVEIDIKLLNLKYWTTWFTDHFLVAWIFEKKLYEKHIYFRKRDEWQNLFEKVGFKCKSYRFEKGKPFTHIVFECVK